MPLRLYRQKSTGKTKKSLKRIDDPEWEEVLQAPGSKFMECANEATHRSKEKDNQAVLKERARRHSTAVGLDERIQIQKESGMGESPAFLNEKGERRKNIDDI